MNCSRSVFAPRRAWLLALALLCMLALYTVQVRAEVAASVHFVSGLVTATASGQAERELAKGSEVYDADQVDTAYNGRVQMRFTDGGLVSLMPNTTFTVEEYRLGAGGGDEGALVFGLLRGGLRTVTGAIGKANHDSYQLKTPVGTLGIRGTEFIVVIGPPGTLRVHVGRGKVVITNEYGSLEVPEGMNAVVKLGSAPMLTEEEPVFLATSPVGDRGVPRGMVREDPYTVELPLADLIVAPNVLQSGPGYGIAYSTWEDLTGYSINTYTGSAVFDGAGNLVSFSGLPDPLPGPLANPPVQTDMALGLSWGVLDDPGSLVGDPGQTVVPYIVGQAVPSLPTTGTLSFSLPAGITPIAYGGGGTGTLTQFDLSLTLTGTPSTSTFNLGMSLNMGGSGVYSSNGGGFLSGINNGHFSFDTNNVVHSGGSCVSGSCMLDVAGFVAKSGGAGVTYVIDDGNSTFYSGVAPLSP